MSDHVITGISETRRGRFAVYIDGAFAFSLPLDTVVELDLRVDKELSDEEVQQYRRMSDVEKCRNKALNLLSYREHSRGDLLTKLQHSFDDETALLITEECVENGLVDDRRFGDLCARELYELRHYGPMRLREELSRHGLSREDVQQVMDQCDFDFEQSAALALREKYGDWAQGHKERVRAVNGMYRLGYSAVQTLAAMGSEGDPEEL